MCKRCGNDVETESLNVVFFTTEISTGRVLPEVVMETVRTLI